MDRYLFGHRVDRPHCYPSYCPVHSKPLVTPALLLVINNFNDLHHYLIVRPIKISNHTEFTPQMTMTVTPFNY